MPMEHVHLRRRHSIEHPLNIFQGEEVSRSIQKESPMLVEGSVADLGSSHEMECAFFVVGMF